MIEEGAQSEQPLLPLGSGPFEQVLYALSMEQGTLLELLGPDMAVLRLARGSGRALLLRWRLEEAQDLPARLKPMLAKLATSGEVEVALVGGPREARRILRRAVPFFSTHRIYLYHVSDSGEPWRNVLLSPANALVWRYVQRLSRGSLPTPDWEFLREKFARDRETLAAERRELQAFTVRGRAPVVTYALLVFLAAVFVLEFLLGGSEYVMVLTRLGALIPERVRAGQWWRLLSCTVLHAGFLHFAFNAYVLLALGSSLERLLGARRFLVLYWTSAISGSASSAFLAGHALSVGASGALWGLLAAEAALAFRPRGLLPPVVVASARQATVINLVINVVNSFRPHVDMAAHLGGGVAGALLVLSGLLTRSLPRLDGQHPEQAQPEREPVWLAPAAALMVLLASLSFLSAALRGRAWVKDLTRGSPALAAPVYEDACAGGESTSCFNLGLLYSRGEGVTKEPARAAALYRQACDGGEPTGCLNFGVSYARGEGVGQDPARAAALYQQACDAGEAKGCSNLGALSERGEGVAKDAARAAALYKQACDAGNSMGCFNLGILYRRGEGITKDTGRAVALYKQACEAGLSAACEAAGQLR